MKKYVNGKYISLSKEEIELIENEKKNKCLADADYEEEVNTKIRERYTQSQEFAILRQRYEKPDEFREYYEYCERCKNSAKELKESDIHVS